MLAEIWRGMKFETAPFVHPADRPIFEQKAVAFLEHPVVDKNNYDSYETVRNENFLHLSLLPVPYIGDLENAKIFILMLNPGMSHKEEYVVESQDVIRQSLIDNILQSPREEPFF